MRIAIIAPPFISVPPVAYGGTELFIAHLAESLASRGHHVIVYANGQSRVRCEVRWLFEKSDWPPLQLAAEVSARNIQHHAWALADANLAGVDVVHINDATAVPMTRFLRAPAVHTLHHPHEPSLSEVYGAHGGVSYVAISDRQRECESLPRLQTIHHGIPLANYVFNGGDRSYLAFLGRIVPVKGVHHAVAVARLTGIPLKVAGEIQPVFREYWEREIRPYVDGRLIEYLGEATKDIKNDLLAHAIALLFPIEWEEPFGLVMIEAMACGTPVLALPGGSVGEVVRDGISGWICRDVQDMANRALSLPAISPASCREYVYRHFSVEHMTKRYELLYQSLVAEGQGSFRWTTRSDRPLSTTLNA
jgi:glycosyltransferase involved in cell wall biosynthesis